jgi:transcriptional regulator with XRE-family HTH domain
MVRDRSYFRVPFRFPNIAIHRADFEGACARVLSIGRTMSAANIAFVNPSLIQWARDRAGVSADQLAEMIGVSADHISAWEKGHSYPPFTKAEKVAEVLRIPFGYLFLSDAPTFSIPLPDLRTVAGRTPPKPSLNFLDLLNSVMLKQEWYRDYLQDSDSGPLEFVGRFSRHSKIKDVADDLRQVLSINDELRRRCRSWDEFLRTFTAVPDDRRMADALFREVPEDDEEDEDEKKDEEEDDEEGEGYSE